MLTKWLLFTSSASVNNIIIQIKFLRLSLGVTGLDHERNTDRKNVSFTYYPQKRWISNELATAHVHNEDKCHIKATPENQTTGKKRA
jgi:hypothetical protein